MFVFFFVCDFHQFIIAQAQHLSMEWFTLRDMLFHRNGVVDDFPLALRLLRNCIHPDAVWLKSALSGHLVTKRWEAVEVLQKSKTEARNVVDEVLSLAFASCLGEFLRADASARLNVLSRQIKHPFGLVVAAQRQFDKREKLELARLSAELGERDGMYLTGCLLLEGDEEVGDGKESAKKFLFQAAELGHMDAKEACCRMFFPESDLQRWRWLSECAALGSRQLFLREFASQVEKKIASNVFCIGRALNGKISNGRLFRVRVLDHVMDRANEAVQFYQVQLDAARNAVDAWTFVGIRFNIVKDVRKLIGKLIWEARFEANYFEQKEKKKAKKK